MGGKAFTSAPYHLQTPRLPPPVYERLKDHLHVLLSSHYRYVATPVPAPEKESHGDIDILVAEPFDTDHPPDTISVQKLLGADHRLTGSPTKSFALRLSAADTKDVVAFQRQAGEHSANDPITEPPLAPTTGPRIASEEDAETAPCALADTLPSAPILYAQIDFRVCHSPDLFHWQVFQHGHGDLWNLLGTSIRPFGLTANERGLHVRIPEIERLNRTRALVWLTASPAAALRFLGYEREVDAAASTAVLNGGTAESVQILDTEFDSLEEMYRFVVRGRFFRRDKFLRVRDDSALFKANDRQRMKQRPGYRRFVLEWIPQLQREHDCQQQTTVAEVGMEVDADDDNDNDNDDDDSVKTRDWQARCQVLHEALRVFGQRPAYEEALHRWRCERRELEDRQATRAQRKAAFADIEEYGRAWTEWLESNAAAAATAAAAAAADAAGPAKESSMGSM